MEDAGAAQVERLLAAQQSFAVPWQSGTVQWRKFGAGPALVLLHGGHGSWLHWVRNIEALASKYTVWVPDMPGYGDSTLPDQGEASLAGLLEALGGTLDLVIGETTPFALAGFSFGGLIAARLAATRPRVNSLTLLGPGGHGGTRRPRGELLSWRTAWADGDHGALAAIMRHNLSMHMLHARIEDIDGGTVALHTDACLRTRFRSKAISRAGGLTDALAGYAGPKRLIWGEHDVTAEPESIGPRLVQHAANAHLHIVAGAGHWVQFEQCEQVNGLLLQ